MEDKKLWYFDIVKKIRSVSSEVHKKDVRFFQVELLEDLAKHTQRFSKDCEICEQNKSEIDDIVENVAERIDTIAGRQKHTNQIDKLTDHLRKEHKMYFRGYFLAVYSLLGMAAGTALGALVILPVNIHIWHFGALVGFAIGLLAGRVFGKIKEGKLLKNEQFIKN